MFLLIILGFSSVFASYFEDPISDEIQCQCVPPHLCGDNDDAANGQGLLDIRFENDPCPNHFDVCCDNPLTPPPAAAPKKCGLANTHGIRPRITSNSEKTSVGELPWTVLLFDAAAPKDRNSFICGGSLIHPQVVVTAGHCVVNSRNKTVKVRAGEWNIRNKDEPLPHQDEAVKEILVHTQYRAGTLWNDIALLILEKPLIPKDNIGFVCLPAGEFKVDEGECVASGWGKRDHRRRRMSTVLRKVALPLVGRSKCQKALRGTKLGKSFRLHRSFMCAGGEKNKDTCKGDGGSPLVCRVVGEEDRFIQVGIVSWGIGCGSTDTPGVYVNVALFASWIERQMKARNFDTTYYKIE